LFLEPVCSDSKVQYNAAIDAFNAGPDFLILLWVCSTKAKEKAKEKAK
jgi:hypothetical protein